MNIFVGVVLVLLAGFQLYRGRVSVADENNPGLGSWVQRSKKPVYFWFVIALELVLGVLFLLGFIHVGSG